MTTIRFWVTMVLLLSPFWRSAAAEPARRCVVCQHALTGRFYWLNGSWLPEKQSVCEPCYQLPDRCFTCQLPAPPAAQRRLEDGRILCGPCAATAVFDSRQASRIYEETRRDLQGLLAGTGLLPDRHIHIALVNQQTLRSSNQTLPSAHEDNNLLGLTRTTLRNRTQFQHEIFLLTGLSPTRLAAVAAHEYTHAWIHENVPKDRRLERDTVEGFCELIAYKLMTQRGDEMEKRIILANAYTRGQVNAFVQAESTHQFHRVIHWLKTGRDESLTADASTGAGPILVVETPSGPAWPPPAFVPTTVPDQLVLRGISGQARRRFALINDQTLVPHEEARVRVGATNMLVRCLSIGERSVVVQVQGRPDPLTLTLGAIPARAGLTVQADGLTPAGPARTVR